MGTGHGKATMRWWIKAALGVGAVAAGGLIVRWQTARHFVEEPRHSVLRRLVDGVEVRRYEPVVVAETRVEAAYESAPSEGFRRLAGYIFGGNRGRESIAMTAPVVQEDGAQSERIAMTAPVVQASGERGQTISFVMPPGRSLESLPLPNDTRVTLREVPAREIAVLRYSGTTDEAIVAEKTAALRAELARHGLVAVSEPVSARYDPPTTLPFLRRNEIWIEVAPAG
jgi:hypothetical protein